jgi:N-acetylglucosaminyl-diphospho-decaprenol L-rhamnosyltransferase
MQPVKGTLSIVSHGHAPLIRSLLQDLAEQSDIGNWLILVTINIPEAFDAPAGLNLRMIHNLEPKGFGANHNAAAAAAEGVLFLIVNPDIRLPQYDTLARIAAVDWSGARPVLRAPVVVAPDGVVEDSVRANLSLPNLVRRTLRRSPGWEVSPGAAGFFWLAGMFLIAPLATFRAVGGFDERFRMYCEDYDLSARWRVNGWSIEVLSDVTVVHDARRDSHGSWRHLRWHLDSLTRVWRSATFWRIVTRRYQ